MKTLDTKIQIFSIFVLISKTVTAIPQLYQAEDGKEYFIETELKVFL